MFCLCSSTAAFSAVNAKKILASRSPASEQNLGKPECKILRWQGSVEKELMRLQFGHVPRATLIQIAWGESMAEANQSVAPMILYYLYSTERHRALKDYFESLATEIGNGKFTMRGLAARFPIRKDNVKVSESLSDLCASFEAASQNLSSDVVSDWSGGPK